MSVYLARLTAAGLCLPEPVHRVGKLTTSKDSLKKIRNIPQKNHNNQEIDPKTGNLIMWQTIYKNHLEEGHLAMGGHKRQK